MEDASDVTYYVDDVVIATSRDVVVPPLVAPGRRKLFVDAFAEYRRTQDEQVRCLPAVSLRDFGIAWTDPLGTRGITLLEEALRSGGQGDRGGDPARGATRAGAWSAPPPSGARAARPWRGASPRRHSSDSSAPPPSCRRARSTG